MSWEIGNQKPLKKEPINEQVMELDGYLEDTKAKIWLYKFLKENVTFTTELLTGIELFPFQHMAVKAMMENDYFLGIWARGMSKSFSTGIFALLDATLNQGVHIGIISKSFRQSKMIFRKIEEISQDKKSELFRQCIGKISKSNDEWSMQIGKSRITALPLGDGEKLRGFRFQRIIIDELLLMPEKVLNEVIVPFLAVVENPTERQKIKDAEDAMIAAGKMTEDERKEWPSNKMIGLSSASYKFEYLYKMYQQYENMIFNPGAKNQGRRCIMQFSYDCAPKALYDENLISQAKGTMSQSQIDREFNAQFTDDSAGYFKISKMADCTIVDGESPAVEVAGDIDAEYIMAFDPSWSESEASDDFAIQVIKLIPEQKKGVLVHSYALPGTNLKKHINYFKYILDHFNIIMIVGDYNGGVQFINSCNESDLFKKNKLEIGMFEGDFNNPHDYSKDLREARRKYNVQSKVICHLRKPLSVWIRNANEMLQTAFDRKKIYFAATAMDDNYSMQKAKKIPIKDLKYSKYEDEKNVGAKMSDFIEHHKDRIEGMKKTMENRNKFKAKVEAIKGEKPPAEPEVSPEISDMEEPQFTMEIEDPEHINLLKNYGIY